MIVKTYDSLSELMDKVHKKPSPANSQNPLYLGMISQKEKEYNESWYGVKLQTRKIPGIIKSGYKPGLDMIERIKSKITITPPPSLRRKRTFADFGDEYDIHRARNGHIDTAWSKCKREGSGNSGRRHIKIAVNIGGNCYRTADSLMYGPAYGIVIADAYASAGYHVEFWVYATTSGTFIGGEKDHSTIVKILSSDMPFDIELLANTAGFPGFFRTLIWESFLSDSRPVSGGLGRAVESPPADLSDALKINNIDSMDAIIRAESRRTKETV